MFIGTFPVLVREIGEGCVRCCTHPAPLCGETFAFAPLYGKPELPVVPRDGYPIAVGHLIAENRARDPVFQRALDESLEWTGAKHGVVPFSRKLGNRVAGNRDGQPPLREPLCKPGISLDRLNPPLTLQPPGPERMARRPRSTPGMFSSASPSAVKFRF